MRKILFLISILTIIICLVGKNSLESFAMGNQEKQEKKIGYDDTPIIPGTKWHVHDGKRPQPKIVTPGPFNSEAGKAPSDAIVLFDGKDLSKWTGKGGAAKWKIENGYMEVVKKTGDIETKDHFGNCQLHVEWRTPAKIVGESQGRGNSGVFLMGRYEIQVLDSYNNPTYPDGQAAAIYGQTPPLVNASRAPGEWQSYDIIFEAPEFDGDKLKKPAFVTVIHNGVMVHHHQKITGTTEHKKVGKYSPHPAKGPLKLQDHGNPIRFRNIWIRPL